MKTLMTLILLFSYLIQAEENIDAKECGDTPLHLAQDIETAKVLIQEGANVNAQNCDGKNPLEVILISAMMDIDNISITELDIELILLFIEDGAIVSEEVLDLIRHKRAQLFKKPGKRNLPWVQQWFHEFLSQITTDI